MDVTLTEICQELRNWFDRDRRFGIFTITGGVLDVDFLIPGQYFRIVDSLLNDGIYKYERDAEDTGLKDETFDGAVWSLAIPAPVLQLAEEIKAWRAKYEGADSAAMSPYMSESFGGYSYQKGSALTSSDTSGAVSWKRTFAGRMNAWRKL